MIHRVHRPCKHRHAFILGAQYLWCPDCGAIRALVKVGTCELEYRWKKWVYPDGPEEASKRLSEATEGK